MNLLDILTDGATLTPLELSLKVISTAGVLQLLAGVPLALWLSRTKGTIHNIVDTLVTLPLVFPPVATGFVLLLLLGRNSPVSTVLGDNIVFGFPGLVIAAFIAGLPLLVKPVQAALKSDEAGRLCEVAAVLGKSEFTIFLRVLLPCARRSIMAGLLLSLARSLGEVGMSLMLGGNVIGRTNTLSLEIYNAVFNGEFERAAVLSSIIGIASISIFAVLKKFSEHN